MRLNIKREKLSKDINTGSKYGLNGISLILYSFQEYYVSLNHTR